MSAESGFVLSRQVAFENLYILAGERCLVMVIANEALWLKVVDESILLVELPIERDAILVAVPFAVEPYSANLAIVGEQLGELRVHEVIIGRPVGFFIVASNDIAACASNGVFVACPVDMLIVEVHPDSLLVALLGKLLNNVAPKWCGVDNVVVALFGVPH